MQKCTTTNLSRPNLFRYATSELSQDAFIMWLLSWASPEIKVLDYGLHECGLNFLNKLFSVSDKPKLNNIESLEIKKQYGIKYKHNGKNKSGKIDVLVLVNNEFVLIIEDKTNTKNHSGQLKAYRDAILSEFPQKFVILIYLKTGDQCSYSGVNNDGYSVFLRHHFLEILRHGRDNLNIKDAIFCDFHDHMEVKEKSVLKYEKVPLPSWTGNNDPAWSGFFTALRKRLGTGSWGYVPNKSNGFIGFWWYSKNIENIELYLQLEEKKLCFKIDTKKIDNRAALKNKWSDAIICAAREMNIAEITKPKRLGNGRWMTVAIWGDERCRYLKEKDSLLDMNRTIDVLIKCQEVLDRAVANKGTNA